MLIPAIRDLFVAAAATRSRSVLHATLSRGCPGGPQEELARAAETAGPTRPLAERQAAAALEAVSAAPVTGEKAAAQFALYVLGEGQHMGEINGCIASLKESGVFDRAKNFVNKLSGNAGPVFATVGEALYRSGPPAGHVTVDLTVSANSPSVA